MHSNDNQPSKGGVWRWNQIRFDAEVQAGERGFESRTARLYASRTIPVYREHSQRW